MNSSDQNALVARSKCYLLLGDPSKGLQVCEILFSFLFLSILIDFYLQDAETALAYDKSNIRAIYQKAEALYFLGQFELSLMFFHRGLRLRPELACFRLGVQKTQEAIEKTIGGFEKESSKKSLSTPSVNTIEQRKDHPSKAKQTIITNPKVRPKTAKLNMEKRESRKLLGELCVDKEYLENLLKHPNLKRADTGTEYVSTLATDAVRFLDTRQEFWRQQRPCTALPKKKQMQMIDVPLPKWY